MADIERGKIDCVVVYKVDRLSRSLLDFARMMEVFERHQVSFVSVTQHHAITRRSRQPDARHNVGAPIQRPPHPG